MEGNDEQNKGSKKVSYESDVAEEGASPPILPVKPPPPEDEEAPPLSEPSDNSLQAFPRGLSEELAASPTTKSSEKSNEEIKRVSDSEPPESTEPEKEEAPAPVDDDIATLIAESEEESLPPPPPPESVPVPSDTETEELLPPKKESIPPANKESIPPEPEKAKLSTAGKGRDSTSEEQKKKELKLSSEYVQPMRPTTAEQTTQHDSPAKGQTQCTLSGAPADLKYTILDTISGNELLPCNECDTLKYEGSGGEEESPFDMVTNLILTLIERLFTIAKDKFSSDTGPNNITSTDSSRKTSEENESAAPSSSIPPAKKSSGGQNVDTVEFSLGKDGEVNEVDIPESELADN